MFIRGYNKVKGKEGGGNLTFPEEFEVYIYVRDLEVGISPLIYFNTLGAFRLALVALVFLFLVNQSQDIP